MHCNQGHPSHLSQWCTLHIPPISAKLEISTPILVLFVFWLPYFDNDGFVHFNMYWTPLIATILAVGCFMGSHGCCWCDHPPLSKGTGTVISVLGFCDNSLVGSSVKNKKVTYLGPSFHLVCSNLCGHPQQELLKLGSQ